MRKKLQYLVIHCTATPECREVSSDEIRQWHTGPRDLADGQVYYRGTKYINRNVLPNEKIGGIDIAKLPNGRGWRQVGYSDLIHLDGKVENLVPYDKDQFVDDWEITNGVAGINGVARHVVYAGGGLSTDPKDTRTMAQRDALKMYVLKTLRDHPQILISGHYQHDSKKPYCPGFNVPDWARSIGVPLSNIYKG